jgi:4-amino-4-deoxy-L-arabinose transferase-like glycosyltransferase
MRAAIICLLVIIFVLLSGLISVGIFESIPHVEDESAYWFQAQVFANGTISVPTPPEPDSYWSPFVIDYNGRRVGKYPPGFPLLLSLGIRAGAPWLVNALLGAAALALLADTGRRMFSPSAGLFAAALGLTVPVLLTHAGSLLSHPAAIFCTAAFLWCFAGTKENIDTSTSTSAPALRPPPRALLWAAGAGLGLGFLAVTRPFDALGVGLPVALYWSVQAIWRRRHACMSTGLLAGTVTLLVLLTLPLFWHTITGSWLTNPYRDVYPYDHPGFGPTVGPEGYTVNMAVAYLGYNLRALAYGFLGWPLYLNLAFIPIAFMFPNRPGATGFPKAASLGLQQESRRGNPNPSDATGFRQRDIPRSRQDYPYLVLATVIGLILTYSAYWYYGGHDAGFPRYYTAAIPSLLLLTGAGIDRAAVWLQRIGGSRLPNLILYPLLIALTAWNAFVFLPPQLNAFRGKYGITAAEPKAITAQDIAPALVLVQEVDLWYDFAPFFATNNPTLDSKIVYAIYHSSDQAGRLRALFSDRSCFVWDGTMLAACSEE